MEHSAFNLIYILQNHMISHTNVFETETGDTLMGLGHKQLYSAAKYKVLALQIYLLVLHSPGNKTIKQSS